MASARRHLLVAMSVIAGLTAFARNGGAQTLDVLEPDDYLDPGYLAELSTRGLGSRYLVAWMRSGLAYNYRQRTELQSRHGNVAGGVAELYWSRVQLTAAAHFVASDSAGSLFRSKLGLAVYLPDDSAEAASDEYAGPFRVRASIVPEQRQDGPSDIGWSLELDGRLMILPFSTRPSIFGVSVDRFESRGETTLLYYSRYPLGHVGDWLETSWGWEYGRTWTRHRRRDILGSRLKTQVSAHVVVPNFLGLRASLAGLVYDLELSRNWTRRHGIALTYSGVLPSLLF